jgi:hypothetical protein
MSPAIHMKFAIQVLPIYLSRVEPGAYCSNLVERTSMIGLCKLSLSALALGLAPYKAHAGDKSGIHAFFNERQEPVRRLLAEQQQQGQIKVSDGRPWRPMWVMLHTASCLELRFWEEDYHVYCASPTPGRSGHVGSEVCPARIAFIAPTGSLRAYDWACRSKEPSLGLRFVWRLVRRRSFFAKSLPAGFEDGRAAACCG